MFFEMTKASPEHKLRVCAYVRVSTSVNGKYPIDVINEIYGKDFHQKLNLKKLPLKEIDFRIRRK